MFTSFASNIETIVTATIENVPSKNMKILDVGGAFGKYALLIKEGIASIRSEAGDLSPDISDIIIDNFDISDYFKQISWLKYLYNNVIQGDIIKTPEICNNYDLVLMIDVIEHIPKETFLLILNKINKPILISTPKEVCMYEHEHYGFARHCSQWTKNDFNDRILKDYSTLNSHILLIK